MRKRIKVVNGESQVTTSFKNEFIQKKFFDFLSQSNFCGHITMQAIIDEADNVHLIECNPRVGGSLYAFNLCWLRQFLLVFSEILGENLSTYPFLPASKPVTLVRYPNDIYL
jgi:carbamoyl-phosphate synthase large subunit